MNFMVARLLFKEKMIFWIKKFTKIYFFPNFFCKFKITSFFLELGPFFEPTGTVTNYIRSPRIAQDFCKLWARNLVNFSVAWYYYFNNWPNWLFRFKKCGKLPNLIWQHWLMWAVLARQSCSVKKLQAVCLSVYDFKKWNYALKKPVPKWIVHNKS